MAIQKLKLEGNFKRFLFYGILALGLLGWFWLIYLYKTMSSDANNNTRASQHPYRIPSLYLTKQEYSKTIPNIQYIPALVDKAQALHEPTLFPLHELISAWDFDDTTPSKWKESPAHPHNGNNIARFDFQIHEQKQMALKYREAEIPFVVYNVPEVDRAAESPFSMDEMLHNFGNELRSVEKSSSNNHFMYYSARGGAKAVQRNYPLWTPPQEDVEISFGDYLREVETAEGFSNTKQEHPLYYMTISASEGAKTEWIRESLPSFKPKESFFMINPSEYRGINCRFGMKGVAAAVHYDGGRNFIAMIRGRKRYVLLPPSECGKLELYPRGHPSARHSSVDWSNITQMKEHPALYNAMATEVVLSMGEVLYLPSYWFHYIVSQDGSIQCNTRSGDSVKGHEHIADCGFYKSAEEERPVKIQVDY